MEHTPKSGYLNKDFQLFHLKDQTNQAFEYHYHEFNKIILFLSGNVTYSIEGRTYHLKPWDILLIGSHDIHKPSIDPAIPYERIIIWVDSGFLNRHSTYNCNILTCFHLARERCFNLVRLSAELQNHIRNLISQLEENADSDAFGAELLCSALFLELLIHLNRIHLKEEYLPAMESVSYNPQILPVLNYINAHLSGDLTIECIAECCYISKYYLMHKFKKETGYTLHQYILQKRLLFSLDLIKEGLPISKVSLRSGFKDYSTYLRAFKKQFGLLPSEYLL